MKRVPCAGDIMNRRPVLLSPRSTVRDAARLLIRRRLVAAPVVDEGARFVGVFSHHGLMLALVPAALDETPSARVADYLEPPPPALDKAASLMSIAQIFVHAERAHPLLPVLDGDKLVGTIARLDLARAILQVELAAGSLDTAALYFSASEPEATPFHARRPKRDR